MVILVKSFVTIAIFICWQNDSPICIWPLGFTTRPGSRPWLGDCKSQTLGQNKSHSIVLYNMIINNSINIKIICHVKNLGGFSLVQHELSKHKVMIHAVAYAKMMRNQFRPKDYAHVWSPTKVSQKENFHTIYTTG